ncbi:MAG: nitrilase-related carbon-nitrogen hydrolase, partial [Gammaproteobacteria bacterium]
MLTRDPGAYLALALQVPTYPVAGLTNPKSVREHIRHNIERIGMAAAASAQAGADARGIAVRLVVLPEYVLTGAPSPGSFAQWRSLACLEINGAEYDALGRIASDGKFFLAGNAYEADPHFPEIYFQCSFVVDPAGNVILRYRRLISLYSPSPCDVWDRYLQHYGLSGIYPVVRTAIGNL